MYNAYVWICLTQSQVGKLTELVKTIPATCCHLTIPKVRPSAWTWVYFRFNLDRRQAELILKLARLMLELLTHDPSRRAGWTHEVAFDLFINLVATFFPSLPGKEYDSFMKVRNTGSYG